MSHDLQLRNTDSRAGGDAAAAAVPGRRTQVESVGTAGDHAPVQRKEASPAAASPVAGASMERSFGVQLRQAPVGADVRAFHDGPRGIEAQKTNNAGGGDPLKFTDIDATGKKNIEDAIALAKTKVAAAITDIAGARTGPQPKAAKYFKITGDKSSDDLKAIDAVVTVFTKVQAALGTGLKFEGEKPDGTTQAYVYTGFIGLFDGAVHIHFPGFNGETADERAAILIHELSHKYAGTGDHAYLYETAKWAKMDRKDAVANADSYCYYAVNAA